jgi:putative membrane protein
VRHPNFRMSTLGAVLGLGLAFGATADVVVEPSVAEAGHGDRQHDGDLEGVDDKLAGADRTFVEKAALGGMAEVELGNTAQQKAASDQVKQFAARMVTDQARPTTS